MKHEDILRAQEDAERFIESVQEYLNDKAHGGASDFEFSGSKCRATVRRRSMDLTRALSAMRNPK
ncbi:MAG TPA: hypothetical protein VIG45_06785 [Erysipelothrix sp.]